MRLLPEISCVQFIWFLKDHTIFTTVFNNGSLGSFIGPYRYIMTLAHYYEVLRITKRVRAMSEHCVNHDSSESLSFSGLIWSDCTAAWRSDRKVKEWWTFLPARLWCLSLYATTLWSELPSHSNQSRDHNKGKGWSGVFLESSHLSLGQPQSAQRGPGRGPSFLFEGVETDRQRKRDG